MATCTCMSLGTPSSRPASYRSEASCLGPTGRALELVRRARPAIHTYMWVEPGVRAKYGVESRPESDRLPYRVRYRAVAVCHVCRVMCVPRAPTRAQNGCTVQFIARQPIDTLLDLA